MATIMTILMPILAAADPAQGGGAQGGNGPAGGASPWGGQLTSMLMLFAPMILIFWFLLIRPQKRYQRERQAMLGALKKHDQVLTRGGILGTIMEIRPDREEIVVEIAKGTRVRMRRSAIEAVIPREEGEPKEEDEKNR